MVKQLCAVVVVLATQAGDGGCQAVPWACDADTRGIRVENAVVTDEVSVTCTDPKPRTHRLDAWIDYRPENGDWRRAGEKKTTHDRPDPKTKLTISAWECAPGDYRAAWQVTGIAGDPGETPFNRTDWDAWGTPVAAQECLEG